MLYARSVCFLVIAYLWTIVASIAMSTLMFLPGKEYLFLRVYGRGCKFLFEHVGNMKLHLEGLENIPKEGQFIVASKHQSTFETFILQYCFPKACYVLKQELLFIPFFGWALYFLRSISIDRSGGASTLKKVIAQAKDRLKYDRTIIIFPEGTRVKPGQHVKYQPGVTALYNALNLPVLPIALNSGMLWPKGQLVKKPGVVTFKFLPVIEPGLDKSKFMTILESQIEGESAKLCNIGDSNGSSEKKPDDYIPVTL